MRLKDYDGQIVILTDIDGNVFEGEAVYNSEEFCEVEFGIPEEGLEIANFMFSRSNIRSVRTADESGPWAPFRGPYGTLEEMNAEEDIDTIEEMLFEQEDIHVLRMVRCLGDHLNPASEKPLSEPEAVITALRKLGARTENPEIRSAVEEALRKA
jgi:hypothetical protein